VKNRNLKGKRGVILGVANNRLMSIPATMWFGMKRPDVPDTSLSKD
jgi:hypothetical protein